MRKMYGKAFFVLVICLFAGSLFSCSNEDPVDNSANLKFLTIANAKSLYISSGSSNRSARSTSDSNKIFKITDTGYVEEVRYIDEDGNQITMMNQPVAINTINDNFIFVGFGWDTWIKNAYIVRKSDGAVFCLDDVGVPIEGGGIYFNEQLIKTDNENNIYYTSKCITTTDIYNKLVKISLNNSDFLSAITISPSTDSVGKFYVDRDGNVFYTGFSITGNRTPITRLKKANGGLANLNNIFDYCWIGLDGKIYYCGEWTEQGIEIKRISVDSSYNVIDEIYDYAENYIYLNGSYKIDMTYRIVFISGAAIYELYNDPGIPRPVNLTSLNIGTVMAVTSSDNYYYIAGSATNNDTFLIKINPTDDSYIDLLPRNDYEVYAFTASETDGIVFNALRMSDGKKVLGKVGINGGDVTMLDEESNAQVICLERIN